ncbi:MAG TPA: hypothetical protein ENJ35_01660 [Gammaproteobacteria bacterium]|nr:hypothetical protein [Gammaproteobacteria bacterium]
MLRFIISALLLLPFVLFKPRLRCEILPTLPIAMIISLFFQYFLSVFFKSLNTTIVLNTGALYTLIPFITALLCIFVFREKMSFKQVIVYLLGVAGTFWVVFNGDMDLLLSFSLNKGDLIFIVGTLSMSCYAISMKQIGNIAL